MLSRKRKRELVEQWTWERTLCMREYETVRANHRPLDNDSSAQILFRELTLLLVKIYAANEELKHD